MHRPMTHMTQPKSDLFDPLIHDPSTHCQLCFMTLSPLNFWFRNYRDS